MGSGDYRAYSDRGAAEEKRAQRLISKFRTFAEENPRVVLGALAAGGAVVACARSVCRRGVAR